MAATNTAYTPAEYNTGILRGDTFSEAFSFQAGGQVLDLTGAGARIQIRSRAGAVLGQYEIGAGLAVASGTLTWTIAGAETAGFKAGQYQYDIEITIGGTVRTYLAGSFTVQKDITQ